MVFHPLKMKSRFMDRGYSEPVLNRAFNIANNTKRSDLLRDNSSRSKNRNRLLDMTRVGLLMFLFSTLPLVLSVTELRTLEKYLLVLFNDPMSRCCIKSVSRRAPTISGTRFPTLYTSRTPCPHWLQF